MSHTTSNTTWIDRIKIEQSELQLKLDALNKTLNVESKPAFISDEQWCWMSRQQFHMRQYNNILLDRIANAELENIEQIHNVEKGSEINLGEFKA